MCVKLFWQLKCYVKYKMVFCFLTIFSHMMQNDAKNSETTDYRLIRLELY